MRVPGIKGQMHAFSSRSIEMRRSGGSRPDRRAGGGPNGELQQAPTAKIGLLANSSLRVEPYSTPYAILPHQ